MIFRCKLLQGSLNGPKEAEFCQSAPVATMGVAAKKITVAQEINQDVPAVAAEEAGTANNQVEDSSPNKNNQGEDNSPDNNT